MLIIPNFNTIGSNAARGGGSAPPFEYTAINNNYSMTFDGLDDKITFSDITTSGDFTVSFWAKPTAFNVNGSSFIFGTESNNSNFFKFVSATAVQMKIVSSTGSTNTFTNTSGSNNVVLDEWQNFIATRDSLGNFIMYRNGVQFGSTLTNANTLTINSIGRVITSSIGYAGGVDEFAYWNTALSEKTVEKIYNTTNDNPGKVADLSETPEGAPLVWYRFE